MAQQKIDTEQPVETVSGNEAAITGTNDEHGTLIGFVMEGDRKHSMMWNKFGQPLCGVDTRRAIRNKAAPIDITKPVRLKNDHGNPVTRLHADDRKWIYGYCKIDGDTKPMKWHRDGRPDGWSEAVGPIENVPEPEPIRPWPSETLHGYPVYLQNFDADSNNWRGVVILPNKQRVTLDWDKFGRTLTPAYNTGNWDIRNRPAEPTPEQIEAELLEKFYIDLEHVVGEDLINDYSEALIVQDIAFVRNRGSRDQWEVLELGRGNERLLDDDSVHAKNYLPAYINRENVAEFYEWFDMRLDQAADRAYQRGNAAGRKEGAAYVKRAHTTFLTALNGIGDFFEKDEYIPF